MSSSSEFPRRRPLLLAGPTATGKSEVAMLLAETLDGEIISVDSMQVYRGLDIGTAKPSIAERQRVPHHLIDVVDLTESFDAAQFEKSALQAVRGIQGRGRVPILCGGTGFYFKAFLQGLVEAPAANAQLRAELERIPMKELLAELSEKDPTTYKRIDRQNPRRVFRAIEVIRLTGRPFSEQRVGWGRAEEADTASWEEKKEPRSIVVITRTAEDLHARIEARVDTMFQRGLVEETKRLLAHGLDRNQTAMQAIGYRQVVEHLRGERTLAETIALVKNRTRKFAKRQITWFRGQLQATWFEGQPASTPRQVADQISAFYEGK